MKNMSTLQWLTATVAMTVLTVAPTFAQQPQEDPAPPAIEIQKLTNGVDADEAPGVAVETGQEVTWTYVVTNTGGSTLYNVAVMDSSRVNVTCPGTETLEAGEMMTCVATVVAQNGGSRSQGLVAASTADGWVVDDTDPAFYTGAISKRNSGPSAITIEKLVNGVDADAAPGPSLSSGSEVSWTFVVTNTGSGTLTEIAVADSHGADVTCLGTETLESGESMTCVATGIVSNGPHRSLGLATGVAADGSLVDDRDPSYHVGI